ncbi:37427_t:CDS:2, partial [Gigaspora margarita]
GEININQEDNEALKIVKKAAEIDFVDEIIEPGFENYIEIDKETTRKSQELAEMDNLIHQDLLATTPFYVIAEPALIMKIKTWSLK